jgi:hypothetical protein
MTGIFKRCVSCTQKNDVDILVAARALMRWQFPFREWDDAVPEMRDRFIDGARAVIDSILR